jgi:hypothetical protein
MEQKNAGYRQILTEIIEKQIEIFGPKFAISKAQKILGIKVNDAGEVIQITGPEQEVLQGIISEYLVLSGEAVRDSVNSVFSKYP